MHQLIAALALGLILAASPAAADPLPSWRAGPAKEAITGFVSDVTRADGPEFVPPAQRIAVFDNDGTLWVEQPMYTQLAFVLDRVKALAPQHPQWREQQAFKAAIEGDMAGPGRGRDGGPDAAPHGHPRGHDQRGVRSHRGGLDRQGTAPAFRPPLHRAGLPADAGAAGLPARQRLQDLHRLRRRYRLHAPLDRSVSTASRRSR